MTGDPLKQLTNVYISVCCTREHIGFVNQVATFPGDVLVQAGAVRNKSILLLVNNGNNLI